MSDSREHYLRSLGLHGQSASGRDQLKAALDRAYALRSFEIELYWKRATYFWGFQIAIFAAFGLLWSGKADWGLLTVPLAGLGFLTALANTLSARGSRFWQSNWEAHIDMLEDEFEGFLYKNVWLDEGRRSYSVSAINRVLSDCFVIFWTLVVVYTAWKIIDSSPFGLMACVSPIQTFVGFSLLIVAAGAILLFRQTTRFCNAVVVNKDTAPSPVIWRSPWHRKPKAFASLIRRKPRT